MKAIDLFGKTTEELLELEKRQANEKFTARFHNFTNRLDDTSSIGKARRDLARIKTVIRQKVFGAAAPVASDGLTSIASKEN